LLYLKKYTGELDSNEIPTKYRELSMIIGREVRVIRGDEEYDARVLDIDENCGLVVLKNGGERIILSSGEISVRI